MLIAGCLGFTELAHVLVQTPQRSRTHASIRPRLAIASKPQGSHTVVLTRPRHAVVRAAAAGEMGFQLQAAPLLSTALVFLSWGWLQWKSSAYNSIGDELDAELETLQRLTVEQLTSDARAARKWPRRSDLSTRRGPMEEARTIRARIPVARTTPQRCRKVVRERRGARLASRRTRGGEVASRTDAAGSPSARRPADGARVLYVAGTRWRRPSQPPPARE